MSGSFIGRRRQLAAASSILDRLDGGEGSVIVVSGDAGIGKSRFAGEVAALGRQRGLEVVWAAGWPSGGAPAYWPWPVVLSAVDPLVAGTLEEPPLGGDHERFTLFRSVAGALWQRAAERRILVVLDDAHNIDGDGLLLTRFIARGVRGHRVLLLLTRRSGAEVPPSAAETLDEIGRDGVVFDLRGLAPEEVRELVQQHDADAETAAVQRVRELTGGNPFLIELVLDADLHRRSGPVPDPARRLVETRLDLLDPSARSVVEGTAVLGTGATPSELAGVSGFDLDTVAAGCDAGVRVALLRPDTPTASAFTHELAREAVLASLPAGRLAELHQRCLAVLASMPVTPERARRRAHHTLALAVRSPTHAAEAIAIAWESGRILRAHGSPEAAVELLGDALALHEKAQTGPAAPLVTDLAEAMLATGRLAASKILFRRAATEAEDAHTFARATLGLGGLWLQEDRAAEEYGSYLEIIERAIERLRGDSSAEGSRMLRLLEVRLTAERASVGQAEIEDVIEKLAAIRSGGSPRDLAASLPMLHQTMLGPLHARARLGVAAELIECARESGDEIHLVMGLLLHAADTLLLGDEADRALADLRARADALGMRAILFLCDAIDVMTQMRGGDLTSAESAAEACLQRGIDVGDVDAYTYFSAQLLSIRWYQGAAVELLSAAQEMATSNLMPASSPVFTAAVAALAAEAGDLDTADRALGLLGRDQLTDLLPGSTWLVTMFAVVEAAVLLDDVALAKQAYALLRPYESLPTMAGLAVCCLGSTSRSLGLAARVAGRLDDAVAHLDRAVADNQRLGNRPMIAITRANLAEALLARRLPGDRSRASALIARSDRRCDGDGPRCSPRGMDMPATPDRAQRRRERPRHARTTARHLAALVRARVRSRPAHRGDGVPRQAARITRRRHHGRRAGRLLERVAPG